MVAKVPAVQPGKWHLLDGQSQESCGPLQFLHFLVWLPEGWDFWSSLIWRIRDAVDESLGLVVVDEPRDDEGVCGPLPLDPRPSLRLSATILILS